MEHRIIRVCPGLGDNVWIMQKLINVKEKFNFQLSNNKPQRGKQLFDMLPQVSASCEYVPGLNYSTIRSTSKQFDKANWTDIRDKAFSLACNYHLECGKRIEEYLPDLKTSYTLPYDTKGHGFKSDDLSDANIYIGIYTSAYSTARSWNFWNEREWFDFIHKIYCEFEPDNDSVKFVIIGAAWDIDLSSNLLKLLKDNNIPYLDTIGKSLPYVVELLKQLDYFVGFPSGLSIINETLGKNGMMFYPEHLKLMRYTWADEKRIKDEKYLAPLFCSPSEAFKLFADKSGII